MGLEEKVFGRKRFIPDAMRRFGFVETGGGFRYETAFLGGDFSAVLVVSEKGAVTGTVVDNATGEEYPQIRIECFQGAFVNGVRAAYEELLRGIAAACCRDVLFACDQANRITEAIGKKYKVAPDYPFGKSQLESYGVFRHGDNAKWFALIMNVKRRVLLKNGDERTVDVVNLKAVPETVEALTARDGVFPAYHMNHRSWISVLLDDALPDGDVMALVDESFRLTGSKKK